MAIQFSEGVRHGRLDSVETTIGTSAILEIFTGAAPADCSQPDSGTLLASLTLPSDWMAAASGGSKSKLGTWEDASANAAGTAGHFRIKDSGGTTCHIQGTITGSGGGGDMELDNTSIEAGQQITITTFDLTDGNA